MTGSPRARTRLAAEPAPAGPGRPLATRGRVALVMREVTEQARSQRRLALASEASARIGTTPDITRTAEELLEVAWADQPLG